MKGKNDESADLYWLMLLEFQLSLDNYRIHEFILLCRQQIFVVVKECDDIYHLGRNKCLEFVGILKCLHVLELSSVGDKFSPERIISC